MDAKSGNSEQFLADTQKGAESEPLHRLRALNIVVHPSFLLGNSDHPLASKTAHYKQMTGELQNNVLRRLMPLSNADVLLIMPHEAPSLQSWREDKMIKKDDPKLGNWTSLLKSARQQTVFPKNVFIMGDLAEAVNESSTEAQEYSREIAEKEIVDLLQTNGYVIDEETTVTVGGEFRDLCVYETVKKLLRLPQILRVRIDKVSSFNSAHSYPFDKQGIERSDASGQSITLNSLRQYYLVNDGKEFIHIEKQKSQAAHEQGVKQRLATLYHKYKLSRGQRT